MALLDDFALAQFGKPLSEAISGGIKTMHDRALNEQLAKRATDYSQEYNDLVKGSPGSETDPTGNHSDITALVNKYHGLVLSDVASTKGDSSLANQFMQSITGMAQVGANVGETQAKTALTQAQVPLTQAEVKQKLADVDLTDEQTKKLLWENSDSYKEASMAEMNASTALKNSEASKTSPEYIKAEHDWELKKQELENTGRLEYGKIISQSRVDVANLKGSPAEKAQQAAQIEEQKQNQDAFNKWLDMASGGGIRTVPQDEFDQSLQHYMSGKWRTGQPVNTNNHLNSATQNRLNSWSGSHPQK